MKLYFVYMAVGAADLPAAEADCRNLQAGSSELPEFHRHLPIAPRIAGARAAKRCSIFRRAATASLSGIATSAEHTIMPAAIALQFDMAASPIGSAPWARLCSAGAS